MNLNVILNTALTPCEAKVAGNLKPNPHKLNHQPHIKAHTLHKIVRTICGLTLAEWSQLLSEMAAKNFQTWFPPQCHQKKHKTKLNINGWLRTSHAGILNS